VTISGHSSVTTVINGNYIYIQKKLITEIIINVLLLFIINHFFVVHQHRITQNHYVYDIMILIPIYGETLMLGACLSLKVD